MYRIGIYRQKWDINGPVHLNLWWDNAEVYALHRFPGFTMELSSRTYYGSWLKKCTLWWLPSLGKPESKPSFGTDYMVVYGCAGYSNLRMGIWKGPNILPTT